MFNILLQTIRLEVTSMHRLRRPLLASVTALFALSAATACKTDDAATLLDTSASTSLPDSPGDRPQQLAPGLLYERYLVDTLSSLEAMRGKSGLIKDSIWVCQNPDLGRPTFRDTEQLTGPTNLGLDIILLVQRLTAPGDLQVDPAQLRSDLARQFRTLETIPHNEATGLYFRTYWPDTGKVEDIHLSSVDNIHLAFGLWVAAEVLAPTDPELSATARRLFNRMDFSAFYNPTTGLIGGNMRPVGENTDKAERGDPQGKYVRDKFDYKYFGSEARSLYALGWALGLYRDAAKKYKDFDQRILEKAIPGTIAEVASVKVGKENLPLLRTWDGGGFQYLLPGVLVREDLYSPHLGQLHRNYARRLLADAETMKVPAAHSASAFGVKGLRMFRSGDEKFDKSFPIYNGASGHRDIVATMHSDVFTGEAAPYWDLSYTPHPAFMAASFAREPELAARFAQVFQSNESLSSPSSCQCREGNGQGQAPRCECSSTAEMPNWPAGSRLEKDEPNLCVANESTKGVTATDTMYQPGFGWMDGYYVRGPHKGKVVPVLISLDQAMIALSLHSLLSEDGHTVASRALMQNAEVSAKLKQAYDVIDKKIAAVMK